MYVGVLLFGERLSREFLLGRLPALGDDVRQVPAPVFEGLGEEVVAPEHILCDCYEALQFLPEGEVWLHVAQIRRLGQSSASAFGCHGLLGVEHGIVLEQCP